MNNWSINKKVRIAFLTAADSWSGVEVHTIQLAGALKKKGHDVFIVEFGRMIYVDAPLPLPCPIIHLNLGSDNHDNVPLCSIGFNAWRRFFTSLKADVAILAKGTFKFGNISMEAAARNHFPRFMVIEHLHAPLSKRPLVTFVKGSFPSLGLWWYRQKISGYLRSIFPNKVICVSQALATTLHKDYGYPIRKLVVMHSGIDTTIFIPSLRLRSQTREAWRIPLDACVFGTVGRLSPMKNHAQLIRAFGKLHMLAGAQLDIRLVIVGEGPLRSSLEATAHSAGVRNRVIFEGFSKAPQDIFPGFDVFCFPSTTGESLGIALLEAMSCECPAIASAVGGVPEILNDPRLGWLIPSGNDNALFEAMRIAAELDKEKLRQMGADARRHIVSNFNATDRYGELIRVIESVMDKPS